MQTYRDNFAASCGVLAEGTNANTFRITQPVSFSINGFGYLKAATDNLAFSAGTALGNSKKCAFFVALDTAGNVTTIQGDIVTPSPAGDVQRAAEVPNPAALVIIGAIVVTTGAAATFTPGSTDLSAAGVTFAVYNFVGDYGNTLPL